MENKRTIFITSFYGLIGRNILSTSTLEILKKQTDIRIVILLPEAKKDLYSKFFSSDNVIVEGVASFKRTIRESVSDILFFYLSPLEYWRISRKDLITKGKIVQAFFFWILSVLGRVKFVRSLARSADGFILPRNKYKYYFEKYKPDLVFATDMFRTHDVDVMREAKRRGVFVLGMVRSWDNISTKGLNHFIPDRVLVHGDKEKGEIIRFCDIPENIIEIIGVPHYDKYIAGKHISREDFFRRFNLDPNKKTILISPPLRHYAKDAIVETIVNALAPFEDVQVIIRMQLIGKSNLGKLKSIPNKLAIDAPDSAEDFESADITTGDEALSDMLYHCDIMASYMSTLAIDSVVFNKPPIYIGFNTKLLPYNQSMRWFYDVDCARELIETGGVDLAKSVNELVGLTLRHLADSSLGKEGRSKIIDLYCFKLDGKSGERLVDAILRVLKTST